MKNKNRLLKIIALFAVFSLGASLVAHKNVKPIEVEATQYIGNYAPYTYSGSYYNSINFNSTEGMNGSLRQSLTSLILPKSYYTYSGSGSNELGSILQDADEDPTNSNNMVYLYTRDSVTKNASSNSTWNREHVWPQSLSNDYWGKTKGGTDILHIRPTYGSTNSSRGNTPYGNTDQTTVKKYNNMVWGYTGGGYFEPLDCVKGDVARIIMYLWTAYYAYKSTSMLDILDVFQSYNTLLEWHTMDKPDMLEGKRNNYAQSSVQQNRNPFVDHPELAWKIFGEKVDSSVKSACQTTYPASGYTPISTTNITVTPSSLKLAKDQQGQLSANLTPTNATDAVVWSSSNTAVATVNQNGRVTGIAAGSATITAQSSNNSSIKGQCNVIVTSSTPVVNYGSAENPLNISDAKAVLDINGASISDEPLYVKGVVTSSTYSTQYSNYTIWLQNDDGSNPQAFELYATGIDSSIKEDYTTDNALVGFEVVAYGYGKVYNNTTYELSYADVNGSRSYPNILSITSLAPASYDLIEKFDFVSTLTTYEAYDATKMDNFIKGSSSLGANTKYLSHNITGTGTNPLIGANGKWSNVEWSNYNLLKLGSTSNNCTMKLTFANNTYISRVVVKAAGWSGKTCYLAVNGGEQARITSATSAESVTSESAFSSYIFDLSSGSNEITFQTTLAVMITELELYNLNDGGEPVGPTPVEEINGLTTHAALSYNYDKVVTPSVGEVTDVLDRELTGISGTDYASWSNKASNSNAVYAGQSAGGNESIQLRSNNSNSGIVTTASGGRAAKVTVTWNSNTTSGRTIDIYGDNTAYTNPAELYNSPKGTKLGSIKCGTSTELEISGDYAFIGIRSYSGALYLESISIKWEGESSSTTYEYSSVAIRFGGYVSAALWNRLNDESEIERYGILLSTSDFLGSDKLETKYDLVDGSNVKNFYYDIPEDKLCPALAEAGQVEGLDEDYYIWNLRKGISSANLTKEYVAVAYVVTEYGVIFLNEIKASAKSLAQDLIDDSTNDYDAGSFEGSLGNLAGLK